MGRFNFNTVAMASLAVIFVVFSVSLLSDVLYDQHLDEFGYPVEVVDAAPTTGEEEEVGPESVLPLLASADPGAGESIFRRCASCHAVSDENKVGPGLNGIVGREVAGHAGFGYSTALTAHAAEAPVWSYEELNGFLWDPRGWVPGTSMGFAGLDSVEDRANMIAYLRTISGDPPLPTEEEIAAATATEETAEAVNASAEGDAGGDAVPVEVEAGQGVPGNEVAPESVVDPDDLNPRNTTNDDPAAAVLPNGEIIDDAAADDAAAAGVPVAPLGGGEISEEDVEAATTDGPVEAEGVEVEAVEGDATPVAPVVPVEPEVEGVIVDPTPDAVIVEEAPVDGTVVTPEATAPAATDDAATSGGVTDDGSVRTYAVPIE